MVAVAFACSAQSIIDADNGRNPNDFYQRGIVVGKKAMPYPYLRESDVVWETTIWRDIDFNESFNQFFYFPIEETSAQGRVSLINLIVSKAESGEIDIYEDDDMSAPIDWEAAWRNLAGTGRTVQVNVLDPETGAPMEDEDGEYVMKDSVTTPSFDNASAKKVRIKEFWYIDKQDTRQKVRIVALQFQFLKPAASQQAEDQLAWSFVIPMDEMKVRQMLVNANAFEENNVVAERSYDDVFIERFFDSYVVRESNKYNRAISSYLTGQDAIFESQQIESRIFDIESDMWEY
ncbi:MAG: gliding motility protein GldN [Bacteroidales bacterium]|nr:gliding motility protein GldN [Bacteroidales bacterium]